MREFLVRNKTSSIDCVISGSDYTQHVYSIDVGEAYGKAFICTRLEYQKNRPLALFLRQEPAAVKCPFCQSTRKKIQKVGKRKVFDLFELDDSDGEVDGLETYEERVLAVEVTYENLTYFCRNTTCGKLYKAENPFLSENPKSPFTARTVAFLRDWHRDGSPVWEIVKKAASYGFFRISQPTVYHLLSVVPDGDSAALPEYLLLENKKSTC